MKRKLSKIGRSIECDVIISKYIVSRKQAQLVSYKINQLLIQNGERGRISQWNWQSFQGYSEKELDLQKINTIKIDYQMEIKI
ncbi:hypothetical protein pb186bvf_015528 [Paramecium bursaria]